MPWNYGIYECEINDQKWETSILLEGEKNEKK